MNEGDQIKISQFIDHLLTNPSIRNDHLITAESQIINFISQNAANLKGTFKTPQFFPHLEFNDVMTLILNDMGGRVIEDILPQLDGIIASIDFTFVQTCAGYPVDTVSPGNVLKEIIKGILVYPEVRIHFEPVMNILQYKSLERYLPEVFARRGFLYNELIRVQGNNLDEVEYLNYLKTVLLMKNIGYRKVPIENGSQKVNIIDVRRTAQLYDRYIASLRGHMGETLTLFPESLIAMAVKTNLPEDRVEVEDASARLLYLLCGRYTNYQHIATVDRGAESPDKSWFSVAKKNADHYGYSKRMLDDLFMIAADNSW
jgi:hypothetical protein